MSSNRLWLRLWFSLGLVAAGLGTQPAAAGPAPAAIEPPSVTCARCIVVDEGGTVLWARNRRDRYPNASTTKMVTALLTVAGSDPSEVVSVSGSAAAIGGGGQDLIAGDTYTVRDLLYALLLDSSNESAAALAEHVGGTQERFVGEMNAYLRRIGARRTHFANPHGLDAEGHYASAADLALIGRAVLDHPYLARIVGTRRVVIDTPRGPVTVENRNLLLDSYPGAIGIKTGRTLGAGNVLVAAARRGKHTLIAVAMHSYDAFVDAAALLDHGFEQERLLARPVTLLAADDPVGALVFDPGVTRVVPGSSLEGLGPPPGEELAISIVPSADLDLPIAPGDVVGEIRVSSSRGDEAIDAIALDAVADEDTSWVGAAIAGLVGAVGAVLPGEPG